MKKFVVSFISALLLALSFISVIPASAAHPSGSDSCYDVPDDLFDSLFSVISSDRQSDYYTIIASPFSSSSLSYSSSITYVVIFYNSSSAKLFFDSSSNEYYVLFSDFKSYNCVIKYSNGSFAFDDTASSSFNRYQGYYHCSHYDYSGLSRIIFSTNNVYSWSDQSSLIFSGSSSFHSPVNAQFDFKSDIEFFCCLNGNASALPVDNRVWIEVYDTLVAVETLVYKPHKYVYTKTITSSSPDVPNKHEQVIGDYLLANSVGPYYSISVDTLLHAGCKTDYYYTARAYVYNGSKPYEIANLTFKISSEGISTVDPSLKDPDNPDDPIMKTWNNDNRTYNYYNVNTGAEVDKDKLVYKFDSSVDPSVNGSGQDISDFDFNSDFSTDLTQGAGLVRTLFDKIIQSAGLSGFMITVLSVAVVGWFIFGSRR